MTPLFLQVLFKTQNEMSASDSRACFLKQMIWCVCRDVAQRRVTLLSLTSFQDWVVGKFGRVLPVLQLRCQKGSRIRTMKYDPSKYGHNIRRLDRSSEERHTPITQLTWEVPGGNDDISKKRRGEFPPYELLRAKKSRTDAADSYEALGKRR